MGVFKWGVFGTVSYEMDNGRFSTSLGMRLDANNYSSRMNNPLKQFSPRLSLSYNLWGDVWVNGSIGRYYQLPAYTTMGYKENNVLVNKYNGIDVHSF